jgi:PAT family beta-lactamase induction signal transducer AmpG
MSKTQSLNKDPENHHLNPVLGGLFLGTGASRFYSLALFFFGLSAGLSFFFLSTTLMYNLSHFGYPAPKVGLFAFSGLPYGIRFLWTFLIDHLSLSRISQKFGQRKAWGIVAHCGSCLGFVIMGFLPLTHFKLLFVTSFLTAFFSAVKDITSEACRFSCIPVLRTEKSVPLQTAGFRIGQGMAVSVLPILSSFVYLGWTTLALALFQIAALIFFLKFPLPPISQLSGINSNEQNPFKFFWSTVQKILSQPQTGIFIFSLLLLRELDTIAGPIQTIFLGEWGLSPHQFGAVKNGIGLLSLFMGVLAAGFIARVVPLFQSLFWGALAQSVVALLSLFLLRMPPHLPHFNTLLMGISCPQDFMQSFMNTIFAIYISSFLQNSSNIYSFLFFNTISSLSRTCFTSVLSRFVLPFTGWPFIFMIPLVTYPVLAYILLRLFRCKRSS